MQRTPAAWGFVVPLLAHTDANVEFFGVHAAHVKIARGIWRGCHRRSDSAAGRAGGIGGCVAREGGLEAAIPSPQPKSQPTACRATWLLGSVAAASLDVVCALSRASCPIHDSSPLSAVSLPVPSLRQIIAKCKAATYIHAVAIRHLVKSRTVRVFARRGFVSHGTVCVHRLTDSRSIGAMRRNPLMPMHDIRAGSCSCPSSQRRRRSKRAGCRRYVLSTVH
ncbi:hypothetical protein DFH06DRAFT_186857 [Mycena polygramma]|nr:hypothetical protein DFH06DRAFT_186857 [Mycena polygramma]